MAEKPSSKPESVAVPAEEAKTEEVQDQSGAGFVRSSGRKSSRIVASSSGSKLYRPEFDTQLHGESKSQILWELMAEYIAADKETIQKGIVSHVEYTLARTRFNFDSHSCYLATALSIRDRLIESWNDTQQLFTADDHKRVYYMSLEYLLGRMMQNALVNLNLESQYRDALRDMGYKLEDLYEEEVDPALGNGGLGRLAACFLDSLATLDYPAWGYGIRYDYGIFRQKIYKGYQLEVPDYWLSQMNPWEIERSDVSYDIAFYGHVETYNDHGIERKKWIPGEIVKSVAYDTPIPGYDTFNTINLRLWRSRPSTEFDFQSFNRGDYFKAIEARQRAEYITSVLYPNDSTDSGKELRLKQQYFFCAATIQDVIRRFQKRKREWEELPEKISIQLNDTHPAISILELLRVLVDVYKLEMKRAWNICLKVFSYTNHTVMPEALEKWSVELFQNLLPRHLEILYLINHVFMLQVNDRYKDDPRRNEMLRDMSLIEESYPKKVRMANLCIVGSHAVNGVAALHTHLLVNDLFWRFNEYFPGKFSNKTNGVTPRRWMILANKELAELYSSMMGSWEWAKDLNKLKNLLNRVQDPSFQNAFHQIKQGNKARLAAWILKETGIQVSSEALFDVLVKRIHEYKRQLLDALYMIHRYLTIKNMTVEERKHVVKRVVMVGGKAAPGYVNAKKIIKLINCIGDVVNNDPEIGDLMKVVYLPNYCVSAAQVIIPAADLTQQISTAGTEASGTSNMKFVMNGAIIIGTMDGANVEIHREIGDENIFIFGARVEEVDELKRRMSAGDYPIDPRLKAVFDAMYAGRFGNPKEVGSLADGLQTGGDVYLVCHDFPAYLAAQERVDETYRVREKWLEMSMTGALNMGFFSSDRTIEEYAQEIWNLNPVSIPTPGSSALSRVRSQPHLGDVDKSNAGRDTREPQALPDIDTEKLAASLEGTDAVVPTLEP